MTTPPPDPDAGLPRIWAAHCPFRKSGSPVLGTMGRTIRPVIVMEMDTWNRLCRLHGCRVHEVAIGHGDEE